MDSSFSRPRRGLRRLSRGGMEGEKEEGGEEGRGMERVSEGGDETELEN